MLSSSAPQLCKRIVGCLCARLPHSGRAGFCQERLLELRHTDLQLLDLRAKALSSSRFVWRVKQQQATCWEPERSKRSTQSMLVADPKRTWRPLSDAHFAFSSALLFSAAASFKAASSWRILSPRSSMTSSRSTRAFCSRRCRALIAAFCVAVLRGGRELIHENSPTSKTATINPSTSEGKTCGCPSGRKRVLTAPITGPE